MATRQKQDKRQPWEVDFVKVELSKEQKQQLKQWDMDGSKSLDFLFSSLLDGYKFSLSGDRIHDCVIGSWTSPKGVDGSRQKCLVARGPDIPSAIRAVAFKWFIVLEGEWAGIDNLSDPDDTWG